MAPRCLFRLIAVNCRYTHSCPAIFYVRAALARHFPDADVELLQLTVNDPGYRNLLRIIRDDPAALFFSAYVWNAELLTRLVGDLARVRPGKPMIIGGPQAGFLSGLPDECTLVLGAIEGVGFSFYRDLAHQQLRPVYQAAEGVPFPFPYRSEDFSSHLQNRQILYESSRGCPFSCSYCLSASCSRVVHKKFRTVVGELLLMLQHKPPLVKFVDRTFNDNPQRSLKLWKKIVEIGGSGSTRFHFEVAPDHFTEEQLLFLETVPVGLFQFEIGVQSTNRKTLDAVDRKMDVDRALRTIRRLRRANNIHLHVDLILGLPEENRQSFAESFIRVFSCRPHHIQMGLLKVLPGTPLAGEVERFDIVHCRRPPYEVLATAGMDTAELGKLFYFGECVERFYNNRFFPSLWRYLLQSGEDVFAFFSGLLTACESADFFHKAATQELMVEILVGYLAARSDFSLLRELLIFDWLRCGHRFLPDVLRPYSLAGLRTGLRKCMPLACEPLYTERERNRFFKQGIFYPLSAAALRQLGHGSTGKAAVICFLKKTENSLWELSRYAVLLTDSDDFS